MVRGEIIRERSIDRSKKMYQCLRVCDLESRTGVMRPFPFQSPNRKREEMLIIYREGHGQGVGYILVRGKIEPLD